MTAVREAVFAEIAARLTAIGDAAETKRMPVLEPAAFPARHIFDGGQRIVDSEPGASRYALTFTVEGYDEAAEGEDAHARINELYVGTVVTLMPEPPLGGLAETIEEGDLRILIAPLAGKSRLCFSVDFTVTFPTRRDDPSQSA